jgi:hypothetical protein
MYNLQFDVELLDIILKQSSDNWMITASDPGLLTKNNTKNVVPNRQTLRITQEKNVEKNPVKMRGHAMTCRNCYLSDFHHLGQ